MQQQSKSLSVVFGAALCGALLAGAVMSLPQRVTSGLYADQVSSSLQARQNLDAAEGLSSAFRNVAEALKPSVVSISVSTKPRMASRRGGNQIPPGLRNQLPPWLPDDFFRQFEAPGGAERSPQQSGMGSGVIIREDGFILTNNHVIESADELKVELSDGRKVDGKVIGTDPETDLAVIKIEATGLQPAILGDSEAIQVGDWVLAIGSPFGLDQTVTAGIISGKNRVQGIVAGGRGFEDFLQTDAAINPGNSGGPLVNLRGEVVGINTAILSRSGASAGIGFAIPLGLAKPVMESIIDSGSVRRGFLGAQVTEVNAEAIEQLDLKVKSGALIRGVIPGQPAAVSGLEPGDVVTKVDDKVITSSTQLVNYIASRTPGSSVMMSVNRGGESLQIKVDLQERTQQSMAMFDGSSPSSDTDVIGATLEPLTPQSAKKLGYDDLSKGLVVTGIQDGSEAAARGLQVGDVIEEADGRKLEQVDDEFKTALSQAIQGERVLRMIVRRGNLRFLMVVR